MTEMSFRARVIAGVSVMTCTAFLAGCGPEPVTRTVTTESTTMAPPPPVQVVTTRTEEVQAPPPRHRVVRSQRRAPRTPLGTEAVVEETTETRTTAAPAVHTTTRSVTQTTAPR